jgi:hypothetical protein
MNNKIKIEHPLEDVLNIESGSSSIDIEQQYAMTDEVRASVAEATEKDEEDIVIEKKIDDVYDAAMGAFENQTALTEMVEPRYAARNAEVAANYLNIALNAANSRAKIKIERKRASTFVPFGGGNKTTNNLIVADRNELLRMIQVDDKPVEK